MLYPKIPRKSIALLILCLIFTLVAVGISFLIYFYHNTSDFMDNLRNKWALPDSQYHQYQHNADDSYGSYTHFLANDISTNNGQMQHTRHFPSMTNYHGSSNNNNNNNGGGGGISHNKHKGFKYSTNTHNSIDNRLINTGDTIYIDDYDKINEKSVINVDGDMDMTNIEYFDQIISDHASSSASGGSDNNNIDKYNKNSISSSSSTNGNSRSNDNNKNNILGTTNTLKDDVIIYTKDVDATANGKANYILRQSPKIVQAKADIEIESADDDDDYDDTINSSGSGDFISDPDSYNDRVTRKPHTRPKKKSKKQNERKYKTANNKENLYSVSSEIVSNLSPPSLKINNQNASIKSETATILLSSSSASRIYHTITPDIMRLGRTSSSSKATITGTATNSGRQQLSKVSPYHLVSRKITTNRQQYNINDSNDDTIDISSSAQDQYDGPAYNNQPNGGAWLETRARRIMGNVKKSEERSRQLLLCEEAGGGELCRMLFKGHVNE